VAVGRAAVEVEADQPGDVVGARPAGDGGGVPGLHHPAVLHDDHPVGQHHRVQRVVRHQHGRARVVAEVAAQVGTGVQAGTRVQRGQRLVEQQQPRADGQRPGERHPLGLAAGEPARLVAGVRGQPHPVQPRAGLLAGPRLGHAAAARPERDVVQSGQMREQQVVLEHHADVPVLRRHPVQPPPVQVDVAVVERHQPGERAQGGGLPGAVRAEQRHHLAVGRGQRHVEGEAGPAHHEAGVEAHDVPSQRSRSAARMTTETTSSTRLSTTAASRSCSSAR
jgi:hypothetical protein